MNLKTDLKNLTTADMSMPTCATCYMSRLEDLKVTHDTTKQLSYWLFAPVSNMRPTYQQGQDTVKEICLKSHTQLPVEKSYQESEVVVEAINDKINEAKALMASLREAELLTPQPFDEPIEFLYFDLWH